jgi:hypothetical protein
VSICPRILGCCRKALAGGKRKGDRMTPDGFALAATIIPALSDVLFRDGVARLSAGET